MLLWRIRESLILKPSFLNRHSRSQTLHAKGCWSWLSSVLFVKVREFARKSGTWFISSCGSPSYQGIPVAPVLLIACEQTFISVDKFDCKVRIRYSLFYSGMICFWKNQPGSGAFNPRNSVDFRARDKRWDHVIKQIIFLKLNSFGMKVQSCPQQF